MHILCLGLSHRTANIVLREQLVFSEDSQRAACARLGCGNHQPGNPISEMVILSTCNRVEIYAAAAESNFGPLEDFLQEARGVRREDFLPATYRLADQEAIDHLLHVT